MAKCVLNFEEKKNKRYILENKLQSFLFNFFVTVTAFHFDKYHNYFLSYVRHIVHIVLNMSTKSWKKNHLNFIVKIHLSFAIIHKMLRKENTLQSTLTGHQSLSIPYWRNAWHLVYNRKGLYFNIKCSC